MVLPTREDFEKKLSARKSTALPATPAPTPAPADEGFSVVGFLQDIAQGTARSIASLPLHAIGGEEATITPEGGFAEAIFGTDKPFSAKIEGEDFLSVFGASEETKKKHGVFTGLTLGALDFIPGAGTGTKLAAKTVSRVASATSKTSNIDNIAKNLRVVLHGDEEAIQGLARTLRDVTDPKEAGRLIREAGASPANAKSIGDLATTVRNSGVQRAKFLDDFKKALNNPKTTQGQRAMNLGTRLQRSGLTPEAFFDGLVAKAPLKTVRAADTTLLKLTGTTKTQRAQMSTLKTKITALSRGVREGRAASKADIKTIQTSLTKQITDNLPVSARGGLIKKIKNTNSPKTLDNALAAVDKKIAEFNEAKVLRKDLSSRRSKLAFINKLGELNSTAVRDMKQKLGITRPLRQMNKAELDKMVTEAKSRFKFKRKKGLVSPKVKIDGKIVDKKKATRPLTVSDQDVTAIMQARGVTGSTTNKVKNNLKIAKDAMAKTGDLVTVPSEALRAIGAEPVLTALRKMGFSARKHAKEGSDASSAIIKKLGLNKIKPVISKEDFVRLDIAMKNGASETVDKLAKKYGVQAEFNDLRRSLDGVFKRANEVELDVKYRKTFFPRSFKDDAVTRENATKFFEKESGDLLKEAYDNFSKRMGREPRAEEKWRIINNLMRGFKQEGVTLSKTGSLQRRVLEHVTAQTDEFYTDSFSALEGYFESANSLIEARRFFGKALDVDLKKIPAEAELDDVVGVTIDKLVAEGKLKPENSERLREILQARFKGGQMNSFLQSWKSMSYLTIMGDIFSAITQIGDFEKVMYRAGLREGVPAIFKSIFNPSAQQIKLADLGLDKTIAAEMATPTQLGKMVNQVFKVSGLSSLDRLGKEAFANGVLAKYKKAVRTGDEKFLARARKTLGGEADETFKAIERGEVTENVQFLALNELADFFPITLEEVPLAYLKHPNGRIFYTMKTFTTKQLNNYRREILVEFKNGNRVQASKNMSRLVGYFVVMNMTSDSIKDFLQGKEESFSDKVVDNMLKTVGFNKYTLDKSKEIGLGRAALESFLLPPTAFVDDAVRDFVDVFDPEDDKPSRSVRNIPIGGEMYYWWFGRGSQQTEKAREKKKPSSTSRQSTSKRGSSRKSETR